MSNAYLSLNRPMAPRLIQYLYCISLVLIAFMVIAGIVHGVRVMSQPPRPAMAAVAAAPAAAAQAAQQPPAQAQPGPRGPGMGMRRFHGPMMAGGGPGRGPFMRRGPRMRGPMMGSMMRGASPALRGGLMILLTLIRGLIIWMIIRVLAEIGGAILAMRPNPA